jgi:tetratricopeptide (TPR) repeat protein
VRGTDAERLHGEVRGDLDWIVMKAMDPDRACRYPTASALAEDLQRFLAHEPVLARAPSAAYRARKFVRRYRAAVLGGAVAVAALVAGTGFATVGMVRARRAEQRAAEEAAAARQVTELLVGLFRVSDPDAARGDAVTARELLDGGARRVRRELAGQPAIQGRLLGTMGRVYGALGLYDPARQLLDEAVHVETRVGGADAPAVAGALEALGQVERARGDFAGAAAHYARAIALRAAAADRAPRGPRADDAERRLAGARAGLAAVRAGEGRVAAAESLYRAALAVHERARDDTATARDLSGLAVVAWTAGRTADALPLLQRTLALQQRALGPDHLDVAATLNNLGALDWTLGRYADALPRYARARAILEPALGPDHPDVAAALNNLGETHWKLGHLAAAEPLLRRALAAKRARLAPRHPSVATTLHALAGVLRDGGRPAQAEPLYREALAIREAAFGPGDRSVAETRADLAALRGRRAARAP